LSSQEGLFLNLQRAFAGSIFVAIMAGAGGVLAAELPCTVCAGVRVDNPTLFFEALEREPRIGDEDTFFLAWNVPLDGTADKDLIRIARETGASLWLRVVFRTSQPIEENLERLEAELEVLAAIVRSRDGLIVQAVWEPDQGSFDPRDHAYLIKRAAVAVTGAAPDARFTAGPLNPDPEILRGLYGEEIGAYLDLITIGPDADLSMAVDTLTILDPGKPVVLDGLPFPSMPGKAVARTAEAAAAGIAITIFDAGASRGLDFTPLKVMARELSGNLVYDRHSGPTGDLSAWAFVREDLGIRVVAEIESRASEIQLVFDDRWLESPVLTDLASGQDRPQYDIKRRHDGLALKIENPGEVFVLRLGRSPIEANDAFDQQIDVEAERDIPVEEILRRLQAFEDDQARRYEHFEATRTLHLRFQAVQGAFEASYSGAFFFHREQGVDWVWQEFYAGGVKWKSKRIPKVPLIQPEKVASLPAEIRFTKDYDYHLRGTAIVEGRDCWVIDFKPIDPAPGRTLYRGTVWVDREIFARVRTRAVQLGLQGAVLAAENTQFYAPLDRNGIRTDWNPDSYIFPVKVSGQQTLSVLSITLPIEVETELLEIRIDGENFELNRQTALASESTMLRDTDDGFRYLKKDKEGNRYVETEFDSDRLFLVGGVFWDESVDFPLPLAGVNYLDLDVKGTGAQFDVFFAGPVLNAGLSDPSLFGSRFNGGANINGVFIKTNDRLYRDGVVVPEEEIRSWSTAADFFVGRPIGDFFSLDLNYGISYVDYSRADDTADDFVLPQDTLIHSLRASAEYNRVGYRLRLAASIGRRTNWEYWGLPGNQEYDPHQREFTRWQAILAKTWWLSNFRRIGLTVEHLNGSNLDRFSGYDFGLFGNSVVAGYPSGLVRAEFASGAHLTYGINVLEKIRFDGKLDAVWASNRMTGLDHELLAGFGLQGTLTLPWQLIMNFEAGYAFAGPGEGGVALRVFFLRLFPGR